MSDSEQLVVALSELYCRLHEFGLRQEFWMVSNACDTLDGDDLGIRDLVFLPTSLRALAIEWPEESETLNAAAAACETCSVWGDNGKS